MVRGTTVFPVCLSVPFDQNFNAVKANCFGQRSFRKALPLGPLPDSHGTAMAAWRAEHERLWAAAHGAVSLVEATSELGVRMARHRKQQRAEHMASVRAKYADGNGVGATRVIKAGAGKDRRTVVAVTDPTNGMPTARPRVQYCCELI